MVVHHPVNFEITNGSHSFRMRAVFLCWIDNLRRTSSSGGGQRWWPDDVVATFALGDDPSRVVQSITTRC